MDFMEAVALGDVTANIKCDHEEDKTNWCCVLEGAQEGHLTPNITRDRGDPCPMWPPYTGTTSLWECNRYIFPSQAHHLIPWKQLKKHPVVEHLTKSPPVGTQKLWGDTNYSVNHGNNGKFMPNAVPVDEWTSATSEDQRQEIAEELMRRAGLQLHQGRHSWTVYDGAEEAYKARVKNYLDRIQSHAAPHPPHCEECKDKKDGDLWPPRANMVKLMDTASSALLLDIMAGRIFVSRRAASAASKP